MDSILIIDDEPQIRKLLSRMMELEGYEVFQAADCQSTLKQLKLHNPQVVLCDVFLPDGNGVDMVTTIKKLYPELEMILLTAHGNIPDGVQAIKNGAFDYITKGDDNNKIIPLISRAMAQAKKNVGEKVKTEETQSFSFDAIKGKSEGMQQAVALARKVSATDVTVLLTGETGTGKEVFAQAIHRNSLRKENAFVAVNCSAFSKDLLESEIFGHKAGSFTGAMKDKKGLFEVADNGTIFLDEIGEMAFELQAKLLRVLEAGEYIKIGDTKPTKVNVRVISATNRDLKKEIEQGNFREDLYYRLSVFQIHLPPLRERKEDIELLAESFIQLFSKKLGKQVEGMAPEFLKALKAADWRGNIRELRNVIERSMIVCDKQLTLQDLPIEIQNARQEDYSGKNYSEFELAAMEKRHIAKVLQHTKGNKTEASRLLKIEQKERMHRMQSIVSVQTVNKWAADFVNEWQEVAHKNKTMLLKKIGSQNMQEIQHQYLHAKKRLILLDYDGTLVPFQKRPEDASPTPQLLDTLQKLTADPLNHVVINSGRDHFTLEKWLGALPISFAAEHGAFYKENGVWHKNVHAQEWSPGLLSILKLFVSKTPRSHLEVKETALAWHYRETDAWLGRLRAQQLVNSLISICLKQNLQIMQGNKVIEIKSPEFTKGSEVNRLLLATRYDFILAMGDDTTDDDMFKALPVTAVTVKIGTASESARYNLPVQTDTLPFLQRMTDKSVVKAALKSCLKGQLSSAIDFLKRIINH